MRFKYPFKIASQINKFYCSLKTESVATVVDPIQSDAQIEIKGWVKSLRKLKEHIFFDVNDGTSCNKTQVIIPPSLKPPDLSIGASIIVKGVWQQTPRGDRELKANSVQICGPCDLTSGYPFLPKKTYAPEYDREFLHLRPRTNKFASLLRVRSAATAAIHTHFQSEAFTNVHTPILTSNDCEGAGETFFVQPDNEALLKQMGRPQSRSSDVYFDRKTFLTVSGQLHLEAAVHGLGKVYTFGPTFRAENSKSRLHLSEFYMVEAEMAFVDRLEQIIEVVERLIKTVTRNVLDKCEEDVNVCRSADVNSDWLEKRFPVLEYDDCAAILEDFDCNKGLSKEQELFLVNHCGNVPVFVVNWPKASKPFYVRSSPEAPNKAAALDLLTPVVGELVGGSLRENDYDLLKSKVPSGSSHLDWYLELRKFGGVPTGGFGLGFERYLQFVLGVPNIKDTIPFPRWPHNCSL